MVWPINPASLHGSLSFCLQIVFDGFRINLLLVHNLEYLLRLRRIPASRFPACEESDAYHSKQGIFCLVIFAALQKILERLFKFIVHYKRHLNTDCNPINAKKQFIMVFYNHFSLSNFSLFSGKLSSGEEARYERPLS